MRLLDGILDFNKRFVEEQEYEKYDTTKFPDKKLVILSCMDTRLVELLPQAMNVKNGDVKVINNAGALVAHPFGSIMRSILLAVYDLNVSEACVIGHHDCGMSHLNAENLLEKVIERGVPQEKIDTLKYSGINLNKWLEGFDSVQESVTHSVQMVKNHPLLPKDVAVHGLVIDPRTGALDLIVDGYQNL